MPSARLTYSGQTFELEVLEYQNPDSKNDEDRCWLSIAASISTQKFQATHRMSLQAAELEALAKKLALAHETSGIESVFESLEQDLKLFYQDDDTSARRLVIVIGPCTNEVGARAVFENGPDEIARFAERLAELALEFSSI